MPTATTELAPGALHKTIARAVSTVVTTAPAVLETLLCAVLARGHVLLEGRPGIGKTLLARALAACIECDFRRIQFTNDLMPSDILGTSVWRADTRDFAFVRGPLFANLVLADEINRTSPRTLSCLLEAMEQGRASLDHGTVELGAPFHVLATRNPIEFHGTYPMPEAALDRFLVRVAIDYPAAEHELQLYLGRDADAALTEVRPVLSRQQLLQAQAAVAAIAVREPTARYVLEVVAATRTCKRLLLGASPRAALMWLRAARARAWLEGRGYVLPDDLKALADAVLTHRLVGQDGQDPTPALADILARVAVPL